MLINRVGTFFILLGLGMIGLFVLSDVAKAPSCSLLVLGGVCLALGIILWMRDPVKPGPPANRFRLFRSAGKKLEKKK